MKKYLVMAAAASLISADLASGQANACAAGGSAAANVARDACLQAVDVFNFVAPQLGLALTGGNATLGQGGTLGGLGHFAISLRGNVFRGDLPEVSGFPTPRSEGNLPAQNLPSKKQVIGLPVVDAAIGVFQGIPLGLTNVGGIDLLVSATYVPKFGDAGDDVQIRPQSSTKFGFGARLGLLQESLVVPGISATYFRRDVPTTDIIGSSPNVDLNIADADIKTTAWRVVASKSFVIFGLAAGFGQDKYDQGATISGAVRNVSQVPDQVFGPIQLEQDVTRNNMFADLSVNLMMLKIVGEIGRVSGGTFPQMSNTFSSGNVDDSRVYGSLGLRLGF